MVRQLETCAVCLCAFSLFADWARPDLVAKVAAGEIREARASWWGFDKDDSTAYLQAAINSGAPKLIVEKMPSPWIVTPIRGASNQHIVFEKGAVLLAKRGEFVGLNDWLFYYLFAENARLTGYGATFRMWRDDYAKGKDGKGRDYKRGEWRHALAIRNSSNVTVEGLALEESGGDGANIGIVVKPGCGPIGLDYGRGEPSAFCRNIVLRDLVCDRNHRQGLSVCSVENLLVENCVFSNTDGTWPMDGVDVEPDSPYNRIVNCTFRNCVAENNRGNGFEVALHQFRKASVPASVRFENCRTKGSRNSVVLRGAGESDGGYPKGSIEFDGCDFYGCKFSPLHAMQIPEDSFQVKFANCRASGFGTDDLDAPLALLEAKRVDEPKPATPDISGLVCADLGSRARCLVSTRNFASLGEKDVPFLGADVAGARIVDKTPGEFSKCSPIRMQYGLQFVVYADRARKVRLRARRAIWNDERKPLPKGVISVTTWAGEPVAKLALPDHDSTELAFDAPAPGFYRMSTRVSGCSFIVDETDAPIAVSCDFAPAGKPRQPLRLSRSSGSLYVPVAAGQEAAFLVGGDMPGDKVGVRVFDPDGKLAFEKGAVLYWTRHVAPKAKSDGLWRIEFVKPSNGDMWGFYAEAAGVRPFFFLSPEKYWFSVSRESRSSGNGVASVVETGGVPRFAIEGNPVAATAVMPSPAGRPGSAIEQLKAFRRAGVMLSSDVWTMHDRRYVPRQWWLGDGEYDFELFDALAKGLVDASPDGFIFPRIKIDPPKKWCEAHPDEMMDDVSPVPESKAWRALYRRMFKDVIDHVEKSSYAGNVIGYHIGAFHCGEWLTGEWKSEKHRAYIPPVSCDARDPLPPLSETAARRAAISNRSEAVADLLIDAASCVKEFTGGRSLVGAFFGYPSIAHEKFMRVVKSGKVDFFAAPPHYGASREPGSAGSSQAHFQASYRLHGRVYFEESDFRTFLSDPAFAPPNEVRRHPLGEAIGLVRRSIGKSLAGGWENWWFLLGGNDTFSAPELMESIRIGVEEERRTLASARWTPAEVAVFTAADEYATSGGGTHAHEFRKQCRWNLLVNVLPSCGVPFDSYELSDVADPQLPEYKVYLFPNAFTLSEEMRAKIKDRVRRAGKTAVWVYAPGYFRNGGGDKANVEDMVGVALNRRQLGESEYASWMLEPSGGGVCSVDGWRSVFMPMPPDADALRKAFREAGAHVWMETDDVIAAGRGYLMVHASKAGAKRVQLPHPCDVKEVFGAAPERKGVTEFVEEMSFGETRVYSLSASKPFM